MVDTERGGGPVPVDGSVDKPVDNRGWVGDKWHWAVERPVD